MKHAPAPLWTIALLTIALASPALAVDGVLEINQACAVNTGCFSGDAAGLPVTITAAGSYRLTGNLTVPDENTDGITVSANDVGIDLNNFAIIGPVTCSGTPTTCIPASGTGSGIERASLNFGSTSVKNGSITGMGYYGIWLGDQSEVTNVRVRWNRLDGISAEWGSTVSGNAAYGNDDDGISVVNGSTVSGNTVRGNTGYGLRFSGTESAYSENVISNNTAGTGDGSAVQLGQNACNGNTTCPG